MSCARAGVQHGFRVAHTNISALKSGALAILCTMQPAQCLRRSISLEPSGPPWTPPRLANALAERCEEVDRTKKSSAPLLQTGNKRECRRLTQKRITGQGHGLKARVNQPVTIVQSL